MSNYWIIINLKAHDTHPVSHTDTITMKSYFDEDLADKSDETVAYGQSSYFVPAEYSTILPSANNILIFHPINKDEYVAPSYRYYVWAEPYGSASFQYPGHPTYESISVGRVYLSAGQEKYRGPASGLGSVPSAVKSDDMVIEYDLKIANSVAQFIADEMTNNQSYHKLDKVEEHIERANDFDQRHSAGESPDPIPAGRGVVYYPPPYDEQADAERDNAMYDYGHIVHAQQGAHQGGLLSSGSRWTAIGQEVYFLGGGEWDHKAPIFPVWGTDNRLGNSGAIYYYDIWSNLHYGYIGRHAGFSLLHLLEAAGTAQKVDNQTSNDDLIDRQAVEAGFNLYGSTKKVTYKEVMNIVQRHYNWNRFFRK